MFPRVLYLCTVSVASYFLPFTTRDAYMEIENVDQSNALKTNNMRTT